MSSNLKIKLNSAGIRELLKSDSIGAVCLEQANGIAERAGDGYKVESRSYPERKGYAVSAEDYKAVKDNLKNNTLLKAIGK